MTIAVITIVSGRRAHLVAQHRALSLSRQPADLYFVVAMNDPAVGSWLPAEAPVAEIVELEASGTRLPLAAARNLGARKAIDAGADLLVFLDVDCVPSPELLGRYSDAAERMPGALLGGAVGYLPEGTDAFSNERSARAHFHGFRPRLAPGELTPADLRLFWSLSFALTAASWERTEGFYEEYRGYGGEDTDFAMVAHRAGLDFVWVGGAEAFHQYHPTQNPPLGHLDDILENGKLFADRWGSWPMTGWLEEFEALGLVRRNTTTGHWQKAASQ